MRNADALIELSKKRAKLAELLTRRISDKQRKDIEEALSRVDYAIETVKQRLLQEQRTTLGDMNAELQEKADQTAKAISDRKRKQKAKEDRAKMLRKMRHQSETAESHGMIMTVILFVGVTLAGAGIIYYLWSTSHVPGAGIL